MHWHQGNKQTEKGEVIYHYSLLSPLKEKVLADPLTELGLGTNRTKAITRSRTIDAPTINVLSVIGNFSLRAKWMEGVKAVDQVSHPINHVGVKHRTVFADRIMVFYSSSFSQGNDGFTYSETDENKTNETYFTLKSLPENRTLVVIDYYLKKDFFKQFTFSLFMRKKLSRQLAKSLNNLDELCCQPETAFHPRDDVGNFPGESKASGLRT